LATLLLILDAFVVGPLVDICPFGTMLAHVDDANVPNNEIKLGFGPSDLKQV